MARLTSAGATSSCSPTIASCGRIDTFLDERSGYFFEMNPSGLMARLADRRNGMTTAQWDGIWNARVTAATSAGPSRSKSRSAR